MRLLLGVISIAACSAEVDHRAVAPTTISTPATLTVMVAAPPPVALPLASATIDHTTEASFSTAFGEALALSAGSSVLAVGAWSGPSVGYAGNDRTDFTGSAYVYAREGERWRRTATLAAPHPRAGMGYRVALSADGKTLAVAAMGIDHGRSGDPSPAEHGVVLVYEEGATGWTESARFQSDEPFGLFGHALGISSDGNVLAVGAFKERGGAVHVFRRRGKAWTRTAHLRGSSSDAGFGHQLALSADAQTLVVGAPFVDDANGVAHVYRADGREWTAIAMLAGTATTANYLFGASLALSRDGRSLAVGAKAKTVGVPGVHLYAVGRATATQDGYLTSDGGEDDDFGETLAWSDDGSVLLVGADHGAKMDGLAYRYERGPSWKLTSILEPPKKGIFFGQGVLLSGDGKTAFVSAQAETGGGGSIFVVPHR